MNTPNSPRDFSSDFVVRVTTVHMIKCIEKSEQKTMDRAEEFESDPAKSQEVLSTLSKLRKLRNLVTEFQEANA